MKYAVGLTLFYDKDKGPQNYIDTHLTMNGLVALLTDNTVNKYKLKLHCDVQQNNTKISIYMIKRR